MHQLNLLGQCGGIFIQTAAGIVDPAEVDQLAPGGRMVVPVGDRYSQDLIKITKDEKGVHETKMGGCRFVKLVGEHGWKA